MNFLTYLIKPKKKKETLKQTNKKCNQSKEFYKSHALHELMVRKKSHWSVISKGHFTDRICFERKHALYIQANEMALRPEKGARGIMIIW